MYFLLPATNDDGSVASLSLNSDVLVYRLL